MVTLDSLVSVILTPYGVSVLEKFVYQTIEHRDGARRPTIARVQAEISDLFLQEDQPEAYVFPLRDFMAIFGSFMGPGLISLGSGHEPVLAEDTLVFATSPVRIA